MNPNKKEHLSRLRDAMRFSRRKLEPFRRRHKEAIEQYVGIDYSEGGSDKPVYLNLMEVAADVGQRSDSDDDADRPVDLVARRPRIKGPKVNRDYHWIDVMF